MKRFLLFLLVGAVVLYVGAAMGQGAFIAILVVAGVATVGMIFMKIIGK